MEPNDYADEVKSVIKFGAMDKEGLDKKQTSDDKVELKRIRTKNKTTWDINLSNILLTYGFELCVGCSKSQGIG